MKHVLLTLGIRPDLIRASRVIHLLREREEIEFTFIWSGQHYSDNLKDVFIRELGLPRPDIELGATGDTDAEVVASVIARLSPVLPSMRPTSRSSSATPTPSWAPSPPAQLNIPIVHIEGCMRSYDWRMPEEKYRTTIDHYPTSSTPTSTSTRSRGSAKGSTRATSS